MIGVIVAVAAVLLWEVAIVWGTVRFVLGTRWQQLLWPLSVIALFTLVQIAPWWVSALVALFPLAFGCGVVVVLRERRTAAPLPDVHCRICGGAVFRPRRIHIAMHRYTRDAQYGERRRNHALVIAPGPPDHEWIDDHYVAWS